MTSDKKVGRQSRLNTTPSQGLTNALPLPGKRCQPTEIHSRFAPNFPIAQYYGKLQTRFGQHLQSVLVRNICCRLSVLFSDNVGITMKNHARNFSQLSQVTRAKLIAKRLFAFSLASGLIFMPAYGQKPEEKGKPSSPAPGATKQAPRLTEKEKREEKARELFADAANAQNNGAFELAIEQWARLLKEYPTDALASSAHHFLGICFLQKESPDFELAIAEFNAALQDAELKQREESLVNLGWCLYQTGMSAGEPARKKKLTESVRVLTVLTEKYPDGSFTDKAIFYAAESESRLGNLERAASLYNQLVQNKNMLSSSVRPDAIFGLALTYDEQNQSKLAKEYYDLFLDKYAKHPLVREVRLRSAEIAIKDNQTEQAVAFLKQVVSTNDFAQSANADYALYRYGYALAKAGKFNESAAAYKKLSELFPKSQYSQNSSLAAGQTLMRDKKYDEAQQTFESLLAGKDERAVEAAHWICQISILKNKPAEAVSIARKALEWGIKSPMTILLRMDLADGLSSSNEGREEAKKLYEQIALENPDDPIAPRATYNAAFAALQLGAQADALRWSEAFAKRFPNDPLASDVAYIRSEAALQLGQHESAATGFEQLIAAEPSNPMLASWELRLATARYLSGQYDEVVRLTNKSLTQQNDAPTQAEAWFLQGSSLLKLSKFPEAIQALTKSNQSSASWTQADEALLMLAEAFTASNMKDQAKNTLERILKEFPKTRFKPQVEFRLGQISASVNDFQKALSSYDSVLSSTKDKSLIDYATYGKAFVLIQQDQFEPASKLLQPLAITNRNDGVGIEARIAMSICQRQLNRPSDAVSMLKKLQEEKLSEDQSNNVRYELGLALAASKQLDQAIDTFQGLIQSSPKFQLLDKVYYELAWALKSKGETAKANDVFRQLTSSYPDSLLAAEAFFHVGQSEYENSKYDRAIKAYTVAATRSVDVTLLEKSIYKLGWAYFQQQQYDKAIEQFSKQSKDFPKGNLSTDASFMIAESLLKLEKYSEAWPQYESTRSKLESDKSNSVSAQVKSLLYLHGAQSARELKKWKDVESWVGALTTNVPDSPHLAVAKYELAYAKQNQKKTLEALQLYSEIAEEQRNEVGARSRFMMGEVFFADREFAKAISEFQKVMYGYGGTQAVDEIKNWQARSAFEAGRCSEVLLSDQTGDKKKKAVDIAKKFYEFVINNHESHVLAKQAQDRIAELTRI